MVLRSVVMSGLLLTSSWTVAETPAARTDLDPQATNLTVDALEAGPGSDQREAVRKAHSLCASQSFDEASKILDGVIAAFEAKKTQKNTQYVSLANKAELTRFRAEDGKGKSVEWLDWSYGQAFQLKAFIASARQHWDEALGWLAKESVAAPFLATPYLERGFVYNSMGKSRESLAEYKKALETATAHNLSADKAAALRGIGFASSDLGDLDVAKKAYEQSLQIEPGNKIATHELQYIEDMQAQKRGH